MMSLCGSACVRHRKSCTGSTQALIAFPVRNTRHTHSEVSTSSSGFTLCRAHTAGLSVAAVFTLHDGSETGRYTLAVVSSALAVMLVHTSVFEG